MMPKYPQSHLDPRLPLVLDTRDLPRQPGSVRALTRIVPAPKDLGGELIAVSQGADLELDLSMTSVSEGVYVSGVVRGRVHGECGRCLRDIDQSSEFSIREMFLYPEFEMDQGDDGDDDEVAGDVGRMQGDLIDLEPAVRDAVVLALPVNPLCRPDCPGLCPDCGVHLDELPADHSHELDDPRWAALRNLSKSEE
jgi:uncharacterized protein